MNRLRILLLVSFALAACRANPHQAAPATASAPPPAAAPANITTPEGLVIRDLRIGTGDPCPPTATITMKFKASFADGQIYDSSDMRKRPLTFSLAKSGAIRGLREGIPGMRVGGVRHLHIPWSLAYGEMGRDPVPPKTDLDFEIELVAFDPVIK